MAELDRSSGRWWSVVLTVAGMLLIAAALMVALNPAMFTAGPPRLVDEVVIIPQEAAQSGAQWRIVTHWQNFGRFLDSGSLNLVEFKSVPGWEAPEPVVLRKGEVNARVEGVYKPVNYDEHVILTLTGATTIANRLGPELARLYLEHIGADQVRTVPGKAVDETAVQGYFYASKEVRTIEIQGRGTPAGFEALHSKACDIAMAAHDKKIIDKASDKISTIGLDGVAVIVHRDNPVAALSVEEVGKIFSGEITNWKQVGGPAVPIKVFALSDFFGTTVFFKNLFLPKQSIASSARLVNVHSLIPDLVTEDPWAIGFCSIGLSGQSRIMPLKRSADADAALPTAQAIRDDKYPAVRQLSLATAMGSTNAHAWDFVSLCLRQDAQRLVKRYGFVSAVADVVSDTQGVVDASTSTLDAQKKDTGLAKQVTGRGSVGSVASGGADSNAATGVANASASVSGKDQTVDGEISVVPNKDMAGGNAVKADLSVPAVPESVIPSPVLMSKNTTSTAGNKNSSDFEKNSTDSAVAVDKSPGDVSTSSSGQGGQSELPTESSRGVESAVSTELNTGGNSSRAPLAAGLDMSASEHGDNATGSHSLSLNKDSVSSISSTDQNSATLQRVTNSNSDNGHGDYLDHVLPPLSSEEGEVIPDELRKKTLQPYWDATVGAERIPVVFRFETASITLNAQSVDDIDRVAKLMKSPEYALRKVILVGFSDYTGTYTSNLVYSRERAQVVAKALEAKGVNAIQVIAVGEEETLVSSGGPSRREMNRRVEIWVK